MNAHFIYRTGLAVVGLGIAVAVCFFTVPGFQKYLVLAAVDIPTEKEGFGEPAEPAPLFTYIEITDSCESDYKEVCAVARPEPATSSPALIRLRKGMVLQVSTTTLESAGHTWYKVQFQEPIRYPERVAESWYVAKDTVREFTDVGVQELAPDAHNASSTRHIIIDQSEQMLYAYDGDVLFMKTPTSTGLHDTPTPLGTFHIYKKTPSRYMQGPLPGVSEQYYDLPGVPWDLYFTKEGGAIHGAYWHKEFGSQWSHGCVNLPLSIARVLYEWTPLGAEVIVRD